ncbi:MAG: PAAR-like domain-containing protein [Pseudomonadota bacterium]|nr:PAAR-like domain-containing protein [Pseudomonadota bacterium]
MEHSAARDNGTGATIMCLAPDVCLTPVGNAMVPIPYMIFSQLSWAVMTAPTVKLTNKQAFTMASRTNKVVGDEPGTGGGVTSGVNRGWCRPRSNHSSVFVEGRELIHHDNIYDMNCSGPNGPGNTIGKLMYFDMGDVQWTGGT